MATKSDSRQLCGSQVSRCFGGCRLGIFGLPLGIRFVEMELDERGSGADPDLTHVYYGAGSCSNWSVDTCDCFYVRAAHFRCCERCNSSLVAAAV